MSAIVSGLYRYPLKSGAAERLDQMTLTPYGPEGDRMFMLVKEDGTFLTQRDKGFEQLALISTDTTHPNFITFSEPNGDKIEILKEDIHGSDKIVETAVHGSKCHGYDVGGRAANWFQHYLGQKCRLISYSENHPRLVAKEYGDQGDVVSFADGMPLLVTNKASFEALRNHFPDGIDVPHSRFRSNIEIEGLEAFEEDVIHHLRIGDTQLALVKPCSRCVMTTIDQADALKHQGNEPLGTLAKTRRGVGGGLKGVFYGHNAIVRRLGQIHMGDQVEVISTQPIHPALAKAVLRYDAK